jgi:hypothetical protein
MIHDTHVSQFITPPDCHYVTGTWSDAAGAVAGSIVKVKAATDQIGVVTIPICPPQNASGLKGSFLKTIDIWWNCTVAAMDAVTALIHQIILPADTTAFPAVVALAFTYDTGHDTAAERLTLAQHKMTLTLTIPIFLDDDDLIQVQLSADAAATSVFAFHGARANYTLRL